MTKNEQRKKLNEIFERGLIVDVLPSKEEFIEHALNNKLNMFIGFDPTFDALHLGHAQNFMLMEEFRKLGHNVFLLFGDFTACIGDPSGRTCERKCLTRAETEQNARRWKQQVQNLMDFDDPINPPHIVFNSQWLDKMGLADFIGLAGETTVQRMLERDMFQKRISESKAIHLHEFLYPLLQGFDSVALNADVEVCGTDQTFNALLGRGLVKTKLNKEKFCVLLQLMTNPVTGEPMMSKSFRKGVFLDSGPEKMFGEIMAMPDVATELLLKWNTRVPLADIDALDIEHNPMQAKLFTAEQVVSIFHGADLATVARKHFQDTFSNKIFPENAPEFMTDQDTMSVLDILRLGQPQQSNSELRRLIAQGAVMINDKRISDEKQTLPTDTPLCVRVGKKVFFKIKRTLPKYS